MVMNCNAKRCITDYWLLLTDYYKSGDKMDEIRISYSDDYPSIYEGMNFYLSKYSVKKKKNYIICFVATICISFIINIFEIINSYDGFFKCFLIFFTFICSALSVFYYHIYCMRHLKISASKLFIAQKEQSKEIVLRQDDILFKRDFSSSNYYYDEFIGVIEGNKSVSFIVSKDAEPIIFSKSDEKAETLTVILKEKFGERYTDKSKGGRKK